MTTSIVSSSEPVAAATRIPLAEPLIGGNAADYLAECLASNFVSSVGPFVVRFEEAFAAAVGARYAVACASGTAAIHLALLVLDVGPGDEVLVPSLTFVASANPVRYVGATPVFIDSEADDLQRATRPSSSRSWTAAPGSGCASRPPIEVVHLVGHPAQLRAGRSRRPSATASRSSRMPPRRSARRIEAGPLDGRQVGHDRADRLLQLQRQQAHHDRRAAGCS